MTKKQVRNVLFLAVLILSGVSALTWLPTTSHAADVPPGFTLIDVGLPKLIAVPDGPYTIILRQTVTCTGKAPWVAHEEMYAMRSDHSRMKSLDRTGADKQRVPNNRSIQFHDGKIFQIHDADKVTTSYQLPLKDIYAVEIDPLSDCKRTYAGKPVAGPEDVFEDGGEIAGYRTIKMTNRSGDEALWQAWWAPALGCRPLKKHMEFRNKHGTVTSVNDAEVVSVTRDEPDPALFSVPTGFKEMSWKGYLINVEFAKADKQFAEKSSSIVVPNSTARSIEETNKNIQAKRDWLLKTYDRREVYYNTHRMK